MRKIITGFAAVTAALAFVGIASIGPASAGLITFDEFAVGTQIDDEYAGEGVLFSAISSTLPVIANDGASPDSPVLSPTIGDAIFAGDFLMTFTKYVKLVEFDSGFWNTVGEGVITVFDRDGGFLEQVNNDATGTVAFAFHYWQGIGSIIFDSTTDPFGAVIDNLLIVPEPGTLALLAMGLVIVGFAGYGSRRRQKWTAA